MGRTQATYTSRIALIYQRPIAIGIDMHSTIDEERGFRQETVHPQAEDS